MHGSRQNYAQGVWVLAARSDLVIIRWNYRSVLNLPLQDYGDAISALCETLLLLILPCAR
jgi:hypothetical protein